MRARAISWSKLASVLVGLLFSASVHAQVEFRLAFMIEQWRTEPASFPNDMSFKFISTESLVSPTDLRKARAFLDGKVAVVEIQLSQRAAQRINELGAANMKNQERGSFDKHVGLGVVVDGTVRQVIQGVFEPLEGNTLWWRPSDDRIPAAVQLREARKIADKINTSSKGAR